MAKISHCLLMSRCDFDDFSIAPAVLRVRQRLDRPCEVRLPVVVHDSRRSFESPVADPYVNVRLCADVAHPIRAVRIFGNDVEAAVSLGEPDLNLARAAGPASGRRQI